jgi:hypothetical protein
VKYIFILFFALSSLFSRAQWRGDTSPSYPELVAYLKKLDKENKEIKLFNMGLSDYGLPIYVVIINADSDSTKTFEKARNGTTILINNAIHPGEPDGINASLIWIDEWIKQGKPCKSFPMVAIIPAYNVGGMMQRSSTSRANQNGPEEYGFRGNARNLDLNRDFVKMDSENAFTFSRIFHALDPDVFVDNHVSNGADYQYSLTYISSMRERLAPSMNELTYNLCIPSLEKELGKRKVDLFPYVELKGETPESGIIAFNDLPRYAMGYASMFHSLSFTVETHMLKPFKERVQVTYDFLDVLVKWTTESSTEIEKSRREAFDWSNLQKVYSYNHELTEEKDSVMFKGYEFSKPIDPITNLPRLLYDRSKPFNKYIPHFRKYKPMNKYAIPRYFVVGGQEKETITRLRSNNIEFYAMKSDSVLKASSYRINSYKSLTKPYEGHFKHNSILFDKFEVKLSLKPGDILIPTKQRGRNFILAALIPDAEDSFFSWNFYDSYLQQKEYFSSYVFIDQVKFILDANPKLKLDFEKMKKESESFRNSEWEQLYFIYKNSQYFEKSFMVLPIYSID